MRKNRLPETPKVAKAPPRCGVLLGDGDGVVVESRKAQKARLAKSVAPHKCDAPGPGEHGGRACTKDAVYECACRSCQNEPEREKDGTSERYHACAKHRESVGEKHRRIQEVQACWYRMATPRSNQEGAS